MQGSPTLADWMQGWGTVAGTISSAVAVLVALLLYRHERAARRSDEADAKAAQARAVLVTFDPDGRRGAPIRSIEIRVHNFSNEVILDLHLRSFRRDTGKGFSWFRTDVLPAGGAWSRRVGLVPPVQWDTTVDPPSLFRFELWFTDARGRHWRRSDRKQPVISPEAPRIDWDGEAE